MSPTTVTVIPDSPVPLYHQIARQLTEAIREGALVTGEFLPGELTLAAQWGVSRPTARQALQQLVDQGLLIRKRGVGTRVADDHLRRPVRLTSLYEDLSARGRTPTTEVLSCGVVRADDEVATALRISPGDQVMHAHRVRLADGAPLAIMRNHLPMDVAGDITAEQLCAGGLYALLRRRGVQPKVATQVIGARTAGAAEAATLRLRPGAALLTLRRVMVDVTGRTIELGQHVYDAGRYALETTVHGS